MQSEDPSGLVARLNAFFAGHARLLRRPPVDVQLHKVSESAEHTDVHLHKSTESERLGVLARDPDWTAPTVELAWSERSFASLQKEWQAGGRPRVLSAGGVVTGKGALWLDRRSARVQHYAGRLHSFGGAFTPSDRDLATTMRREVAEECGVIVPVAEAHPLLLAEELTTGYVQAIYLGVRAFSAPRGSEEGDVVIVRQDEIGKLLDDERAWVPSGMLHVLVWLAGDPPGWSGPRLVEERLSRPPVFTTPDAR